MKQNFGIIILGILVGFTVKAETVKSKFFSSNKSTYFEWVHTQSETLLKSSIHGTDFLSEVGITIDDKTYDFKSVSRSEKISAEGLEYDLYRFYSGESPVMLEVAVLNNAVAFRYVSDLGTGWCVNSEKSSFKLPEGSRVYYFERKNDWKLQSYAGTWENCTVEQLPFISGANPVQGPPLIVQLSNGKYAVATEVNLQNYSGLRWDCTTPFWIKANFTESSKGFLLSSNLSTPWRVIFVTDNLNDLVNQTVIKQLSPKPDPELYSDTDYIKPGKSVWRWFSLGTGNPDQEKEFIDYAAELGFDYSMIDEGAMDWKDPWVQLKTLSDYGNGKHVKLILWNHSNQISDPADNYLLMRNWLDKVKQAGIAGIKIDFMNSESKYFVDFEIKLLKECARRKLLVNFHGCQKPTGEAYTYPNEITREGIRGLELNKLKEGPNPSYHNVLLPFTRFVVGHGDYTPLSFVNPGQTTFAHQLATLVAFNSPLQVIAEDPAVLLHEPSVTPALDLIKAVPTVWDQTLVLPQSELGRLAVVARRSGSDWFIYALNGTNSIEQITIPVSEIVSNYQELMASLYVDDMRGEKIKIEAKNHRISQLKQEPVLPFKKIVSAAKAQITIDMAPDGGAVLWLHDVKKQ
jgi:alpha-glucosidase